MGSVRLLRIQSVRSRLSGGRQGILACRWLPDVGDCYSGMLFFRDGKVRRQYGPEGLPSDVRLSLTFIRGQLLFRFHRRGHAIDGLDLGDAPGGPYHQTAARDSFGVYRAGARGFALSNDVCGLVVSEVPALVRRQFPWSDLSFSGRGVVLPPESEHTFTAGLSLGAAVETFSPAGSPGVLCRQGGSGVVSP